MSEPVISPATKGPQRFTPLRAKCSQQQADKGDHLLFVSNPTRRFLKLDLGPLPKHCRSGSYYFGIGAQWGSAMESTGYVMVSLVVIILACMAIFVGTYATELIGTLPVR